MSFDLLRKFCDNSHLTEEEIAPESLRNLLKVTESVRRACNIVRLIKHIQEHKTS